MNTEELSSLCETLTAALNASTRMNGELRDHIQSEKERVVRLEAGMGAIIGGMAACSAFVTHALKEGKLSPEWKDTGEHLIAKINSLAETAPTEAAMNASKAVAMTAVVVATAMDVVAGEATLDALKEALDRGGWKHLKRPAGLSPDEPIDPGELIDFTKPSDH